MARLGGGGMKCQVNSVRDTICIKCTPDGPL